MGYILMNVGVNNRASTINQIFVGVNNIARLVYQGGGGSGSFQLPTFTGSSSIFGDETSGRIELYESGTLTLSPGTYDFFAVGGGGGGSVNSGSVTNPTGGGGGGYTATVKGRLVPESVAYNVTVGGGNGGTGGISSVSQNSASAFITASGGKQKTGDTQHANEGSDGGSGGGAINGQGGSNGGNGANPGVYAGGAGQGSTTRAFGDSDGTLYAGGGAGASSSGKDVAGGAGGGGSYYDSSGEHNGTANTGGGGSGGRKKLNGHGTMSYGGSGIVIVRWNNGGGNYSPTLADNTWSQIAAACDSNDPILDSWNIGDAKDAVVNGETLTFVIVGKNHDDLADGSGKAKLTFGMKELMASTRQMNSSSTNVGSFAGSAMYSWLSGTIYPNLPTELKDAIKAVNKKTSSGRATSTIRTDEMHLWLFAEIEVFGTVTCSFAGEGAQYQYFTDESKRIKKLSNGAGAASRWWLRSPDELDIDFFCCVLDSGRTSNLYSPTTSMGVCFGFCI